MRVPIPLPNPRRLLVTTPILLGILAPGGSMSQVTEAGPPRPEVSFDEEGLAVWAEGRIAELRSSRPTSQEAEAESQLQEVWALYFWGVGEKKRMEEGEALLSRVREAGLGNAPEPEALAAALEVLRAKHSRWPGNKLKHLKAGVSVLDRLVEDYPEDPVVRYLRLASCYSLPFFLSRDESVTSDMAFLTEFLPDRTGAFSGPVHHLVLQFILETDLEDPKVRDRLEQALRSGEA